MCGGIAGAMILLLPGCENGLVSNVNDGTVNQNTDQTDFYIMAVSLPCRQDMTIWRS